MNREQRQRKIDRFMKAAIKGNSDRPSASSLLDSPFQLKESMMMKANDLANDLANDRTVIVQAPGDECTWMVRKCPHYVKASKSSCNENRLCESVCKPSCTSLDEAGEPNMGYNRKEAKTKREYLRRVGLEK